MGSLDGLLIAFSYTGGNVSKARFYVDRVDVKDLGPLYNTAPWHGKAYSGKASVVRDRKREGKILSVYLDEILHGKAASLSAAEHEVDWFIAEERNKQKEIKARVKRNKQGQDWLENASMEDLAEVFAACLEDTTPDTIRKALVAALDKVAAEQFDRNPGKGNRTAELAHRLMQIELN